MKDGKKRQERAEKEAQMLKKRESHYFIQYLFQTNIDGRRQVLPLTK